MRSVGADEYSAGGEVGPLSAEKSMNEMRSWEWEWLAGNVDLIKVKELRHGRKFSDAFEER
jgi:hypothetical protein